jgi:hypothetical protein
VIDLRGMSLERARRISQERTKDIGARRGFAQGTEYDEPTSTVEYSRAFFACWRSEVNTEEVV